MENEQAVIFDADGEPFYHMETLVAHLMDEADKAPATLAPGIRSVVAFLTSQHDILILSNRQD